LVVVGSAVAATPSAGRRGGTATRTASVQTMERQRLHVGEGEAAGMRDGTGMPDVCPLTGLPPVTERTRLYRHSHTVK
jgi:hypothetical protein